MNPTHITIHVREATTNAKPIVEKGNLQTVATLDAMFEDEVFITEEYEPKMTVGGKLYQEHGIFTITTHAADKVQVKSCLGMGIKKNMAFSILKN